MTLREFKKRSPASLTFSPISSRNEELETFMNDDDLMHCMDALSADEMVIMSIVLSLACLKITERSKKVFPKYFNLDLKLFLLVNYCSYESES